MVDTILQNYSDWEYGSDIFPPFDKRKYTLYLRAVTPIK